MISKHLLTSIPLQNLRMVTANFRSILFSTPQGILKLMLIINKGKRGIGRLFYYNRSIESMSRVLGKFNFRAFRGIRKMLQLRLF